MSKVVIVHQSAELYGSDRSFLTALDALLNVRGRADVLVLLPNDGPLVRLIRNRDVHVSFYCDGFLRKSKLKAPLKFLHELARSFKFYRELYKTSEFVYINTVVCVSAILALRSFKGRGVVHIREIPGRVDGLVFRLMLRFSRCVMVFNSAATRSAFRLPGEVVYNGVSASRECVPGDELMKRSVRRLLLIGRINSWKGHELLLSALANINETIALRIVGSVAPGCDQIFKKLERLAKKLSHEIEFFDFTADPSEHYAWADFVVVPSVKPEPFGRVAIEALSYGKPVIAARHGGLTEIVDEHASGFFFRPRDVSDLERALRDALLLDLDEYIVMSRYCLSIYEDKFTETAYMNSMMNLFGSQLVV